MRARTIIDPNKLYIKAPVREHDRVELPAGCTNKRPELSFSYGGILRSITNFDEDGLPHGWTIFYRTDSGRAQKADLYEHGTKTKCIDYDYYGRPTRVVSMHPTLANTCHGSAEYLEPDSKCSASGSFKRGKLHGKWSFYYKGHLYETARFANGVRHGFTTHYNTDGRIISRAVIKGNKPNGLAVWWEDGKIISKNYYVDGKPRERVPYGEAKRIPERHAFSVAIQEFMANRKKYNRIHNFVEVMGSFVDLGHKSPIDMLRAEVEMRNDVSKKLAALAVAINNANNH